MSSRPALQDQFPAGGQGGATRRLPDSHRAATAQRLSSCARTASARSADRSPSALRALTGSPPARGRRVVRARHDPGNSRELAHTFFRTFRTSPRPYNFFCVFLITSVPPPPVLNRYCGHEPRDHPSRSRRQAKPHGSRLSKLLWRGSPAFSRTIAGLKRRTVFPSNWKDHWPGLRELEWYRDQILAFSAKHVLSGGSLDDRTDFQLILDVPDSYGVCPQTPQAMNRRFIAMAQFRLDPDKYIQRHIQRIAKRARHHARPRHAESPLRHATKTSRATSPGFAGGGNARRQRLLPPPATALGEVAARPSRA